MRLNHLLSISFAAVSLLASPLFAQGSNDIPVKISLAAEETSIQSGKPFYLAIHVDLEPNWHTYWVNPGDGGMAMDATFDLPSGFSEGKLYWPTPKHFETNGLTGIGYDHGFTLLKEIIPPDHLTDQDVTISTHLQWVACNDQCVPGSEELSLVLPTSNTVPGKNTDNSALFSDARDHLPGKAIPLTASIEKDHLLLYFALNDKDLLNDAVFYSEEAGVTELGQKQNLEKVDNGYKLSIPLAQPLSEIKSLKGVLKGTFSGPSKEAQFEVDTTVNKTPVENTSSESSSLTTILFALLAAFGGGMILNCMPCVLPVLSLKVLSVIETAKDNKKERLKQGLAYVAGVMCSFWVLSSLLLILRASGSELGWGFQLQEPLFVGILVALLFLMSLNLFGVFEIGTSLVSLDATGKKKTPIVGALWSGVLATIVATPCTGPLLGASLGFAMTLPPLGAFGLFTVMGLGMALPFFLLTLSPSLLKRMPKPGKWMVILKQSMGFLLLASSLWLIWVWEAETNFTAVMWLLIALLILSVGAWIYGSFVNFSTSKLKKRISLVISVVAVGASIFMITKGSEFGSSEEYLKEQEVLASAKHSPAHAWIPFSAAKIDELKSSGKPIFIDFTAKWCLLCQANKVVLHSSEVEKAFAEAGVVKVEADWTKGNPEITKALTAFGRSGVPLYVLYTGNPNDEPILFSETLTSEMLINAVQG